MPAVFAEPLPRALAPIVQGPTVSAKGKIGWSTCRSVGSLQLVHVRNRVSNLLVGALFRRVEHSAKKRTIAA
jgi:hypothetical protein